MFSGKLLYFLLTGAIASGLNIGSRFLFSIFFPYEVAIVLAFFVGLSTGFILMRYFVFEGVNKSVIPQIGKYVVVNIFALIQTLLISLIFARFFLPSIGLVDKAEAIAHFVGVLMPVFTSYFGHKYLTFR